MRMGAGLLMAAMILFASWNICNSQESATRKVFVFQGADGLGVYVARILPSSDEALVKIWGIGNHRWNNRIFRCRIVESGNAKTFVTSLEEKVRVYWADDPERVKAVRSFEGMARVFRMNAIVGKGTPQELEIVTKTSGLTMDQMAQLLVVMRREVSVDDRQWELLKLDSGHGYLRLREALHWADDPERVKAVRSFEGMASVFRMNAIVGKGNPQETELGIKALSMTTNELAEFLDKQTHDSLCSVASCKFYFHHAREIQYSSCLSNKALARSLLDEYQKQ